MTRLRMTTVSLAAVLVTAAPALPQELYEGSEVSYTPTAVPFNHDGVEGFRLFRRGGRGLESFGNEGGPLPGLGYVGRWAVHPMPGQPTSDWDGALPLIAQTGHGRAWFSALKSSNRGNQGYLQIAASDPLDTDQVSNGTLYYERGPQSLLFPKVAAGSPDYDDGAWILGTDRPGHQTYIPRTYNPGRAPSADRLPAQRVIALGRFRGSQAWVYSDFGDPFGTGTSSSSVQLLLGRNGAFFHGGFIYAAVAAKSPDSNQPGVFVLTIHGQTGSSSWSRLPGFEPSDERHGRALVRAPLLFGRYDPDLGAVVLHVVFVAWLERGHPLAGRWAVYHSIKVGGWHWSSAKADFSPAAPPSGWGTPFPDGTPAGFSLTTASSWAHGPRDEDASEELESDFELFGHSDSGRAAVRINLARWGRYVHFPPSGVVLHSWAWPAGDRYYITSSVSQHGRLRAFYGSPSMGGIVSWLTEVGSTGRTWDQFVYH